MEYIIIILVVALAIAPLSHFAPSKRQRAVARMRESAAVKGLFVEFRPLPGNTASTGRRGQDIIYYGKRLPPARGAEPARGSWVQFEDGWRATQGIKKPPEILSQLPSTILAASVDEGSCGVYWRETCEEGELVAIILVIEQWAGNLRAD
jgi:hypothetical protein